MAKITIDIDTEKQLALHTKIHLGDKQVACVQNVNLSLGLKDEDLRAITLDIIDPGFARNPILKDSLERDRANLLEAGFKEVSRQNNCITYVLQRG